MSAVATTVAIRLEADCGADERCCPLAEEIYKQLACGLYDYPISALELPADFDAYLAEHRTARKRAGRAARRGYQFAEIDREDHAEAIFEINTSAETRQGRPMADSYRHRIEFSPLPEYPCARHAISTYGILDDAGVLRAYTWVYRVGDLAMFSQILGHADHLEHEIMYLLVVEALRDQAAVGAGVAFYNRHDNGTSGLVFFKERCGFRPVRVDWQP